MTLETQGLNQIQKDVDNCCGRLNPVKSKSVESVPRSLNEDILMYTWWWKERESSDNERES